MKDLIAGMAVFLHKHKSITHTPTCSQLSPQATVEGWVHRCFYVVWSHFAGGLSESNYPHHLTLVGQSSTQMEYVNGWRVSLNTMGNCGMHIYLPDTTTQCLILFCKRLPYRHQLLFTVFHKKV